MVAISVAFPDHRLGRIRRPQQRRSGWLTLARMPIGVLWTVATAIVAAIFGGFGPFLGYLLLQALICIVTPMMLVEAM